MSLQRLTTPLETHLEFKSEAPGVEMTRSQLLLAASFSFLLLMEAGGTPRKHKFLPADSVKDKVSPPL